MKRNNVKQFTSLLAVGYLMLTISNSFAVVIRGDLIATQQPQTSSRGTTTVPSTTPTAPTTPTVTTPPVTTPLVPAVRKYLWPSDVQMFGSYGKDVPTPVGVAKETLKKYTEYLTTNKNIAATYLDAMVEDVRASLAKNTLTGHAFERVSFVTWRLKNDTMRKPLADFINALYAYLCGLATYKPEYILYEQKQFNGSPNPALLADIINKTAVKSSDSVLYHSEFRLNSANGDLNTLARENKVVNAMKLELRNKTYADKQLIEGVNY